MSIKNIMRTDLVTIAMDETLATVRDTFDLVTFHHLLVVDNGKLVGVVSDRDYLKSINTTLGTPVETTRDLNALNIKVHRIMSRNLVTVKETDSLFELVSAFHINKVSCVPVVDEYFVPQGIVSWKDIVSALAKNMSKKEEKV